MSKFVVKKKQGKALWARTFPSQAAALHPERGAAGGVKWRSKSKEAQDAVYAAIAKLFKAANPWCLICLKNGKQTPIQDVHHSLGRIGLYLLDVRHFIPVCRCCHEWCHAHPEDAKKLLTSC
jgi:hypothetical protein